MKSILLFLCKFMPIFAITLVFFSINSCKESTQTGLPIISKPDKVLNVGILIMEGVYNTEMTAPMDILHHTVFHTGPDKEVMYGMQVFTIANSLNPITTFEGLDVTPDYSYLSDSFPEIDVLVVPSAEHHLDTDLEDSVMLDFVKRTGEKAQYVMSLCDGAFVLAESGLLDGFESTTFPGDIDAYRKRFPQLTVHENVLFVHHGKFITSAGGAKSFEPALYLAELLYGKVAADGIAKGMVIDWDVDQVSKVIVE